MMEEEPVFVVVEDEVKACRKSNLCQRGIKYINTFILVFSWASLGLYCEILGPTIPTLEYQTSSNHKEIGSALAVRSVGLLSGSLFGGWSSDRFARFRPLQMSLALILAAATNMVIPWVRSNGILCLVFYVAGCSHGLLTTNGNPLLASIWNSEASGPFSLMHAGYGLGGAVAPLLVAPFTVNQSEMKGETLKKLFASEPGSPNIVLINLVPPYYIVAATLVVCACSFLVFKSFTSCGCKCSWPCAPSQSYAYAESTSGHTIQSPLNRMWHACRRRLLAIRQQTTVIVLFTVAAVYVTYFAIAGNERVFGKFMFTYALLSRIKMKATNAYLLSLLYWICFCLARVITFLLAFVVPARILMFSVIVGTVVSATGLIVIPPTEMWFFIMTCFFSLFKSPLFPTTLAAINQSCEMSGFMVMVVNFGSASGASLMQYATGSLTQTYGQFVFPYIVFASACLVLLAGIMLVVVLRKIDGRLAAKEYSAPTKEVDKGQVVYWIAENGVNRDSLIEDQNKVQS